jgi:TetR/AcrR family transcriptional regulator, copper-responsive repressor
MTVQAPQTQSKLRGRPRAFDREAALEGALALFWRLGYEPATIAELC